MEPPPILLCKLIVIFLKPRNNGTHRQTEIYTVSYFDYSMGFAMEYAAKQLASSEKSIAEIAAELNFSNRSHFYKLFRERYGMSPVQYKKGGPK